MAVRNMKIIFVAKSMIMASIRPPANANDEVEVQVPSTVNYLHKVISLAARNLFQYPSLMRKPQDESEHQASEKAKEIRQLIIKAIQGAITDMLPHDEICDAYLGDTVKAKHLDGSDTISQPVIPSA